MKQSIFTIVSNVALTDSVYKMVLQGDTSAITAPGQFVNLQLDGLYLRRPISVCDLDGDKLTIVYKAVGQGTEQMSRMEAGEKVDILTGLGNGYELEAIAGCTIGGVSTTGGIGTVGGILVGVLVFELLKVVLQFLQVNPYYNYIAQGLVIVIAVALDIRKYVKKK